MKVLQLIAASGVLMVAGCASHESIVRKMVAQETACPPGNINLTELSAENGLSRYEVDGCGTTSRYACGRLELLLQWSGFVASDGYDGDPRVSTCYRERR